MEHYNNIYDHDSIVYYEYLQINKYGGETEIDKSTKKKKSRNDNKSRKSLFVGRLETMGKNNID